MTSLTERFSLCINLQCTKTNKKKDKQSNGDYRQLQTSNDNIAWNIKLQERIFRFLCDKNLVDARLKSQHYLNFVLKSGSE